MSSVAVNPPKTPVTKGSNGIATATLPNVCKMPPPPPPFAPVPLPNIGQSGKQPQKYSTTVKIEGQAVAIQGASFGSSGDIASKGTGGGIVSMNAEGPAKFVAPGSLNVKIQGKNVQYLGDQTLNNCGPSGAPANSACMAGTLQAALMAAKEALQKAVCECDAEVQPGPGDTCPSLGEKKHACVDKKIHQHNAEKRMPKLGGEQGYDVSSGSPVSTPRMPLIGEDRRSHLSRIRGKMYPDAAVLDDFGRPAQFAEFKFQCPAGVPTRRNGPPSKGTAVQDWTPARKGKPGQRDRTRALGAKQDPPVTQEPVLITNEEC